MVDAKNASSRAIRVLSGYSIYFKIIRELSRIVFYKLIIHLLVARDITNCTSHDRVAQVFDKRKRQEIFAYDEGTARLQGSQVRAILPANCRAMRL